MAKKRSKPELQSLLRKYKKELAERNDAIAREVGQWVLKQYPDIESLRDFKRRFSVVENPSSRSVADDVSGLSSTQTTASDERADNPTGSHY